MGQIQDHALSREAKFFATVESTFATFAKPASANAVKLLTLNMTPDSPMDPRNDSRQHRDLEEEIERKKSATFEGTGYVLPSGSLGVAPDISDILKTSALTETINASTDVQYDPNSAQNPGGLSLVRHFSDVLMESLVGAWIEEFTFSVSGGEEARISFNGAATRHLYTGTATLTAILNATDTTFTVATTESRAFDEGSVVAFDIAGTPDDNSGAGYEVTGVDHTTGIVTITPGAVVGAASGTLVTPFTPSETTVGSPLAGLTGSLKLDGGSALAITSFEFTYKNNHKPIDDEAFTDSPTDYIPGVREITGNIGVRGRRDKIIILARRKSLEYRDLEVVIGDVAGDILQIDSDLTRLMVGAIDLPEGAGEEATATIPFVVKATSAGNDSFKLTWK